MVDPGDGGVDVQAAAALMASIQAAVTQIEVAVWRRKTAATGRKHGGGGVEAQRRWQG